MDLRSVLWGSRRWWPKNGKMGPFKMIMTGEPLNWMMQFIRSYNPIDIDLNCWENVHKRREPWDYFLESTIFHAILLPELNAWGGKSAISLLSIGIIALKDRQYQPRTSYTVFITKSKRSILYTEETPNVLIANVNVSENILKSCIFSLLSAKKCKLKVTSKNLKICPFEPNLGYLNSTKTFLTIIKVH